MKYVIALLFLPQLLSAQLKSEAIYVTAPPHSSLNDSLIYQPEIRWAIGVINVIDVLQPGDHIKQTMKKTIGQDLVQQVLNKKQVAWIDLYGDTFTIKLMNEYLSYANGTVKPNSLDVFGPDKDLQHFFFMQHLRWHNNENRLTSKITWLGMATPDIGDDTTYSTAFWVLANEATGNNKTRKPMWQADHYFECSFSSANSRLLKQLLGEEFGSVIWQAIKDEKVIIKDTNATTPLQFSELDRRCGTTNNIGISSIFLKSSLTRFGVLQHIIIYDDWTVEVEIKGLKMFAPAWDGDPPTPPVAWIYFK